MKKAKYIGLILLLVISLSIVTMAASDTLDPNDALTVQAAKIYPYIQRTVYIIYCRPDRLVDIELQPGETFRYIGGADTVRWNIDQELIGSQWHVFVKPNINDVTISTNFIIGTDRHCYHIEALVSKSNFTNIIAWTYPNEKSSAFYRASEDNETEKNSVLVSATLDKVNFDYKICGAKTDTRPSYGWTPVMVFDDGSKTYIKMPNEMNSSEAPVLFAKDTAKKRIKKESNLMLVNYRLKNGYFVVDQIMDEFELHSGQDSIVRIIRSKKD